MADQENEVEFPVFRWAFLLTALVLVAIGVAEGLRWSDFWWGFFNTTLLCIIVVIPLGVLFLMALTWSVICRKILRKRVSAKWLKLAILSPAIFLLGHGIFANPTSPERFEEITGVAFPAEYSDAKFHHFGGGFADHSHTFVFTTTPDETRRLIRELGLSKEAVSSNQSFDEVLKGYPGKTSYHRADQDRNWYYNFITDETQTKVWSSLRGM